MLQLLLAGTAVGSVYALVAIGFIIIYRATGAVNFAQGDMVTVGAFAALWASRDLGLPILVAWVVSLAVLALVGAVTYRFVYRPLSEYPFLAVAIGTLGLAIMMRAILFVIFGPREAALPSPVGNETISAGGVVLSQHLLLIIAVTAALVALQTYVLQRTFLGKALRATAEDAEVSRLLGLRANRIILGAFVYGSCLAAVAGFLLAPRFFVSLNLGFSVLLTAFVAAIIGGFGSLAGALVGGIVVGLTEILGAAYVSSSFSKSFSFALLIVILLVRPAGIFKMEEEQKV